MGNSKMNARERIDYLFDDHSFVADMFLLAIPIIISVRTRWKVMVLSLAME